MKPSLVFILTTSVILMPTGYSTSFGPDPQMLPWRRKWQPTFLPGKFHGQRSLVGCSPWGHKESDTTEQLHFLSFSDVKSSFKLRKGHFSTVQFSERLPTLTESHRPGVKQSHAAGLIGKSLYNNHYIALAVGDLIYHKPANSRFWERWPLCAHM